jgi:hypothetical protein
VPVEEVSMNAIPSELMSHENNTEVVHEREEALVEVGAVSKDTKGNPFGHNLDSGGNGFVFL